MIWWYFSFYKIFAIYALSFLLTPMFSIEPKLSGIKGLLSVNSRR